MTILRSHRKNQEEGRSCLGLPPNIPEGESLCSNTIFVLTIGWRFSLRVARCILRAAKSAQASRQIQLFRVMGSAMRLVAPTIIDRRI